MKARKQANLPNENSRMRCVDQMMLSKWQFTLGFFLCLLVSPSRTYAQFTVQPMVISQTMVPGETGTTTLKLENQGQNSIQISAGTVDLAKDQDGQWVLLEGDAQDRADLVIVASCRQWLTLDEGEPNIIDIEPENTAHLGLEIRVPAAAQDSYQAAVRLMMASTTETGVRVRYAFVVPVKLEVKSPRQKTTCSGKVVDIQHRKAVVDADVYVYEGKSLVLWEHLAQARTDAQGRFSTDIEVRNNNRVWVVVYKTGLAPGWANINLINAELNFLIELARPATLAGRVLDENLEPIAEAKLRLCLARGLDWGQAFPSPKGWLRASTDAQGSFSFTHLPEDGSADLWIEAPGKAGKWTFWEEPRTSPGHGFLVGREDLRFVLHKEAQISGQVIDEDTGDPVPGIELVVRGNGHFAEHYNPYRAVSNENGRFLFKGLLGDDYLLHAAVPRKRMPEWVSRDVRITVGMGQVLRDVRLYVNRGAFLKVLTKDAATGQAIEGAGVSVTLRERSRYAKMVRSDEQGITLFRVPAGEVYINAFGDEYVFRSAREPLKVEKGHTYRHTIMLDRKPFLQGVVLDQAGQAVENVRVTTIPTRDQQDRTDSKGQFEVIWSGNLKKRYLLAQDFEHSRAALEEVTDDLSSMNVTLTPAYTLIGEIREPNGHGIKSVPVVVRAHMPGYYTDVGPPVLTDDQGRYVIKAIPAPKPGLSGYYLEVSAEGYGPVEKGGISLQGDPEQAIVSQPIRLNPANQVISGIVVDQNDAPAADIELYVFGPDGSPTAGQPPRSARTGQQGRFRVEGVCKGPLRIQADGLAERGFLTAEGGDTDLKVIIGQDLVHSRYKSLKAKPLPALTGFVGLEHQDSYAGRAVLICFWSLEERPSRQVVTQLAKKAQVLQDHEIRVILVQATKAKKETLDQWLTKNKIPFKSCVPAGDAEETMLAWGAKSLPWLILTGIRGVVRAEGFDLSELEEMLGR